jgi:hypothetical protein
MGHMPMCDGKLEKWCVRKDLSNFQVELQQCKRMQETSQNRSVQHQRRFLTFFFLLSSCVHWKIETECDFSDTAWATASKTSRAPCVAFLADDAHPAWPVWHLLLGSWNKSGIYRDDIEMYMLCFETSQPPTSSNIPGSGMGPPITSWDRRLRLQYKW